MRVAFVMDQGNQDGSVGGAELTMREFAQAAPDGVEVITEGEPDVFVVGNCVTIAPAIIEQFEGKRVVRYFNDVDPHSDPELRSWFLENATCVFTSPLHLERFPFEVDGPLLVPPPVDLGAFRPTRQVKRNTERKGAVAIGAYQNAGKGGQAITEWGRENGGIDVYGTGGYIPAGDYHGPLDYRDIPKTLWRYKTFVHLPFALEPFGRAVVEAWAAGCELVVNKNVGALHWIQNEPEKLETAAADFWEIVA